MNTANMNEIAVGDRQDPKKDSYDWIWKLISHAIGGGIFLIPYAVGMSGIVLFCLIVIMEVYTTRNSLIMLRKMAPQEKGIECANYFTIITKYLGGGKRSYNAIIFIFVMDAVIASSIYYRSIFDIFNSTWLSNSTNSIRQAYQLRIAFAVSIFLLIADYVSEKMEKHLISTELKTLHIRADSIKFMTINPTTIKTGSHVGYQERHSINMEAVARRIHGHFWKKFSLFFLFLFLAVSVMNLLDGLPNASQLTLINETDACPGLHTPLQFFVSPSVKVAIAVPIVILCLMQYGIFLPICLDELRQPIPAYRDTTRRSSILFVLMFCGVSVLVSGILGNSAPAIFTTAFGSNHHSVNVNFLSLLFILCAMLLRVMPCCRLIQVLLKYESEASYWVTAAILFVISYFVCFGTPSVLYLAIVAGSCTGNLLFIILPRVAYINFMKRDRDSGKRTRRRKRLGRDQEDIEPDDAENTNIVKIVTCIVIHVIAFVMVIPEIAVADIHIGENCHVLFNEVWD